MRYVFIGGPSTGKTTLIERMQTMGYLTLSETARRLLEDSSVVKPSVNRDSFQREVFRQQLLAEEQKIIDQSAPCFLDGGVFDGCAYYLCDGMNVPSIYDAVNGARYARAFLFEKLDHFVLDGVRYQDAAFVERINSYLESCYKSRGVMVTKVPNLSVDARTQLVLDAISIVS